MDNNLPGQIASELGQIAKDVGKQTAQIPKDIAGKALESLGASGGKKSATTATATLGSGEGGKPANAWEQIAVEKDQNVRRSIARKALEALIGGAVTKKREPSIWERLQAEQEQKKQQQQQQQAAGQSLPQSSGKRPRGDLYGTKAKTTATENRNVRQD